MVLDLFGRSRPGTGAVPVLQKRNLEAAIAQLREQLEKRKRDERLRLQLADLLVGAGKPREAVEVLNGLADDLASDGFAAKAIAVLKKIEKIQPGRSDVEEKLAQLINQKQAGSGAWPVPPAAPPKAEGDEIGLDLAPQSTAAIRFPPLAGAPEAAPPAPPKEPSFDVEFPAPAAESAPALVPPVPALPPEPVEAPSAPALASPEEFDLAPAPAVPPAAALEVTPEADLETGPAGEVVEAVDLQGELLALIGDVFKPSGEPAPASPSAPPVVQTPLFASMDPQELLAVMRKMRLVTFEPGQVVVAEGQPGASLFVITGGWVRAYVHDPETRGLKEVRQLGDGEFFGEISVLAGGHRTATIVAADHCELLEFDKSDLDEIAASHPRVREVMIQFYEQRFGRRFEPPPA